MSIAIRYAKSLFLSAQEKQHLDSVHNDLKAIVQALKDSPDLKRFIHSPVITFDKRKKIIDEIFKPHIHAESLRFIIFLAFQRRLNLLSEICEDFDQLYLEHKNMVKAQIISSSELNQHLVNDICHHMKLKLRREIIPSLHIDKSLIGGIKIKVGDFIYDYSIASQLNKFKYNVIHS